MQNPFSAYRNAPVSEGLLSMESTIVIKVKYGETLRRFNAHVNEAGQLNLDIGGLREKVSGLFNFAPDADLTLTYVDEDGDVVTLVDEEDLRDVMRQSLNPLRITVKLNAEKGGIFYAGSNGNSTPTRSPKVQHPFPNLNSNVSEILKSVPEPLLETLSKLMHDLASKASSSSPGLAEVLDCFSKMRQSYVNPVSEFQAGTESSTQSGALGSAMGASMTKETEASRDDGAMSEVLVNAIFEERSSKTNQKVECVNSTRGLDAMVTPVSVSLDLNAGIPGDSFLSGSVSANLAPVASHDGIGDSKEEVNKISECHLSGKAGKSVLLSLKEVTSSVPAGYSNKDVKKSGESWKCIGTGASPSTADVRHSVMDSTINMGSNTGTKFPTMKLVDKCPFPGMQVPNDSGVSSTHHGSRVHPFTRSYTHSDGLGGIFHKGVQCDGCGVHPITGLRFKSKVKENYDLCSICFSEMGSEADYIRMDRPVSYQRLCSFKGLYDPMQQPRVHPPTLPHVLRGFGMKPSRPKLDSHFIMDVNVLDGTLMAPSTPFTKIWRMQNNGTIVWPQGTQLVWIGGDELSTALSFELQISADGLHVGNELDVAGDFTAPKLPGRYISYWRMASPSGQKFGQRIWVLIEVIASLKDSMCDNFQGLNLNLPPEDIGISCPESINVNGEPMAVEGSRLLPKPDNSDRATELVEPLVDAHLFNEQELSFPINDTLLVGGGVSHTVPPKASTPISLTITQATSAVPSHASAPVVPASVQGTSGNKEVEQTLLRELEEMGFKQVDLNKEILRLNEYDLGQSVDDDLCGVAEWDPILEELQDMGFRDEEMNRRLLKKNNGSIKHVVMDLITGEKA